MCRSGLKWNRHPRASWVIPETCIEGTCISLPCILLVGKVLRGEPASYSILIRHTRVWTEHASLRPEHVSQTPQHVSQRPGQASQRPEQASLNFISWLSLFFSTHVNMPINTLNKVSMPRVLRTNWSWTNLQYQFNLTSFLWFIFMISHIL